MESRVPPRRGMSLGQAFAALGAILSLVLVAWEIRQNTAAVRGATYQDVAESNAHWLTLLIQNPELQGLMDRWHLGDTLSNEDWRQVRNLQLLWWRSVENAHYQVVQGNLPEDAVSRWINRSTWETPVMKEWWAHSRRLFTPRFVEYIEQNTGVAPP